MPMLRMGLSIWGLGSAPGGSSPTPSNPDGSLKWGSSFILWGTSYIYWS